MEHRRTLRRSTSRRWRSAWRERARVSSAGMPCPLSCPTGVTSTTSMPWAQSSSRRRAVGPDRRRRRWRPARGRQWPPDRSSRQERPARRVSRIARCRTACRQPCHAENCATRVVWPQSCLSWLRRPSPMRYLPGREPNLRRAPVPAPTLRRLRERGLERAPVPASPAGHSCPVLRRRSAVRRGARRAREQAETPASRSREPCTPTQSSPTTQEQRAPTTPSEQLHAFASTLRTSSPKLLDHLRTPQATDVAYDVHLIVSVR